MLDSLVKKIDVPCSQEKAFDIFVNAMSSWWPLDRFTMSAHDGKVPKSLTVDAKEGGQIVEIGHDDTEHLWGTIKTYDPFGYLAMHMHMGMPPCDSLVEIKFQAVSDHQTQVELTHSNWEAYGEMADMMYNGYGTGWTVIFEEEFKAACSK
jgi:hypothetical protein